MKIAFYPESLTASTGSLWVVPGSHRHHSPDLFKPLREGTQPSGAIQFGLR